MAKKKNKLFKASLVKNLDKGGAWLATVSLFDVEADGTLVMDEQVDAAWKNASAGKRWIKAETQRLTPRKSVKLVPSEALDEKEKPAGFFGELAFKVDA